MTKLRKPYLDDGDVIVYAGDCIEVMRELPEASVDAVVTDPPYGLEFMGKEWDAPWKGTTAAHAEASQRREDELGDESKRRFIRAAVNAYEAGRPFQAFSESWAREALRVLKPGGHLLAFAGTRTYHRMACGVEDAGFEIRDCIAWMYGSGFPKSKNVSLAIDKGEGHANRGRAIPTASTYQATDHERQHKLTSNPVDEYEAKSETARKWSGWGTALKPAFEPVVVARKPLIGTVAENVQTHGTGALNIDACRIAAADPFGGGAKATSGFVNGYQRGEGWQAGSDLGRWPANVALDETAASMLDEQSGHTKDGTTYLDNRTHDYNNTSYQIRDNRTGTRGYNGEGGASRFFYTAKASRQDRNAGGLADNTHPTVKPTDLMRWLIRLVTPPGGIILDPFGGSGSTGLAARAENVRCILIEREDEYLQIISDRLAQLSLLA